MSKEDLKKIAGLSKEEVLAGMKAGEIMPPRKGKERQEFMDFVNKSKEDREKYLADGVPPTPTPEPPKGEEKKEPPAPPVPPEKKEEPGTPPVPPAPVDDQWYKEFGYEGPQKAKEAHKQLIDLSAKLQENINKLNAEGGKRGQEMIRLKKENEALGKEISEIKVKLAPPKVEKPVKPKKPNPSDATMYPDGRLDVKYMEDMDKYDTAMETYQEQAEAFNRQSILIEVEKKIPAPAPAPAAPVETASDGASWDKLFNQDIPEFQKRLNLVTSVPIRQINDNINVVNAADSTPEQKASAQAFLNSVPPADHETYKKVKTAIETVYDFTSGIPVSRYKTIEGGLFDNGLIGEGKLFNPVKPVQLSAAEESAARERAKQGQSGVPATPASAMAGGDKKISEYQTANEKQDRYMSLTRLYNTALNKGPSGKTAFEASPEYQEYLKLQRELIPNYKRRGN